MKHDTTAHVLLDTNRCIDCGKCIEACPKGVLGQVNFLIHKHAHVDQADICIGCLNCVKACQQKAIIARRDLEKAGTAPDVPYITGQGIHPRCHRKP